MKAASPIKLWLLPAAVATVLSGCSQPGAQQQGTEAADQAAAVKPVTITVFSQVGDALFKSSVIDPVQKKFPHITITQVKPQKGVSLQDMVTSGTVPDLLDAQNLFELSRMELAEDLAPYVKKHGLDLGAYSDTIADALKKSYYFGDKLLALPYSVNVSTLHYNKEIFDKLGISYPKDGMTWEEAIDLSRKLAVTDNGVAFRGLDIQLVTIMNQNQLSMPVVDKRTNKAQVDNDGWKRWFHTMKAIYDIEGNKPDDKMWNQGTNALLKDKNLAMLAVSTMFGSLPEAEKEGLKWDVVTLPSFADKPGVGIQAFTPHYSIAATSPHKEEAFKVISFLLSEEGQLAATKVGRPSVLKNQEINKSFGAEIEVLKGKNAAAYYKNKSAGLPESVTKYDSLAYGVLQGKFKEVALNGKDVNTALREAEEEINKRIETELAGQK